jgi:hypothetical protein
MTTQMPKPNEHAANRSRYPGILADVNGGLTPLGRTVMDAWVFGLLDETEACAGWGLGQMQDLLDKLHQAWEPYGHLPSRLPEELRARHTRIYEAAVARAQAAGWDPELGDDD